MEYKKISVSWFKNHTSVVSNESINIWLWLLKDPDCLSTINQIRSTSDKEVIRQLKEKLPCVTFSGTFLQRKTDKLIKHSGLICIDIDGKDNPEISDMENLKQRLSKLPYVLYAGLSVSGKGVFCLIPIACPNNHLGHFYAIEEDFQAMGINIDPSCKDITRLRYCSYDLKPVFNLNATLYEKYTETSAIIRTPKMAQKKTDFEPKTIHVQAKEEKILSIEEQFLQPMVDVNSDRPIQVFAENAKTDVRKFIEYVVKKQTDITEKYNDWLDICMIIAQTFHEDGRELFHAISQFYPNYTPKECNQFYNYILNQKYKKKVDRLYEIAKQYGL